MKDKIIIFIIGLLFGAVISTGSIYFYSVAANNSNNNNNMQNMQMPSGNDPGQNNGGQGNPGQNDSSQTPPEKPSDNTTQSSN